MTEQATIERVRSLVGMAQREEDYLRRTDARLFPVPLTAADIQALPQNDDFAERVDAFVARFGRLQDTLGAKLLPSLLSLLEETPGAMIENLDLAERLGLIESSDQWASVRKLRNRMIHEYVKDPNELVDALNAAHEFVPTLTAALESMVRRVMTRYPDLLAKGSDPF